MALIRKTVSADMLTPIIDLPWISKGLQVEVIIMPLHKTATTNETCPKITDLKGLGRDVWKNVNIEDHVKKEREAWD
jgi:hypothetical protein